MGGYKNHTQANKNKPNKSHGNQFKNKNPFRNKFNKFNKNFDGNRKQIQHEATPWSELKQNLPTTNNVDLLDEKDSQTTKDRQNILKQRDESYRKFVIQEKQKEKPKWEKFDDISNDDKKSEKKVNNVATASTSSPQSSSPMTFKKQNDYRKTITRFTSMSNGVSLQSAINDLKRRGVKRFM